MDIQCSEDSLELLKNSSNDNIDDDDDDDDNENQQELNSRFHHNNSSPNVYYENLAGNTETNIQILNGTDNNDIDYKKYNQDSTLCYRANKLMMKNWYFNLLLPITIIFTLIIVIFFCRNYAKKILFWIEHQNSWLIFIMFLLMFTIVSFPIVIGYLLLIITCGYLFGLIKGLLTVILSANFGVFIAHNVIKSLHKKIPFHRLIKNETGRAILRVISGPRAFKVVMFTRLTPIPFGLQNTIFGVSFINSRSYHSATLIGLLPAQAINVYLGSTLRSMHDVLNDHNTAVTGYIIFALQVLIGICLMMWVIQKAKNELSEALLSDTSTDHARVEIDV